MHNNPVTCNNKTKSNTTLKTGAKGKLNVVLQINKLLNRIFL